MLPQTSPTVPTSDAPVRARMGLFRRKNLTPQEQVQRNLRDIEKQGSGLVGTAHVFSAFLIVGTSLATLISIAARPLHTLIAEWQASHTVDIPIATSLAITGLIVLACDTGMLLAANRLRVLASRKAPFNQQAVHIAVMVGVALLEALTYGYMLFKYEPPQPGDLMINLLFITVSVAVVLIVARALGVPLISIYLAMAKRFAITPSDIQAQVELMLGIGVLADLVKVASDPLAPIPAGLPKKLAMYDAAADLTDPQHAKLLAMYRAARGAVWFDNQEQEVAPNVVDADPVPDGRGLPAPASPEDEGTFTEAGSQSTLLRNWQPPIAHT